MIKVTCVKVDQPIGRFYITALPATILSKITTVDPRDIENEMGVQRHGKKSRIKEISEFCSDPDATFPTAVVVSVDEDKQQYCVLDEAETQVTIDEAHIVGQVIDGQHRLKGLMMSDNIEGDYNAELDKYIEQLKRCEYIQDDRAVKKLCEKAKELLIKEENIIYLNAPITVSKIIIRIIINYNL